MTTAIKTTCSSCGITIFRSRRRMNESKKYGWETYCSARCLAQNHVKKQVVDCENHDCGIRFAKRMSQIRNLKSAHNYCSRSCAAIANNKMSLPKSKICANPPCSKLFTGSRKYCSDQCSFEGRRGYTIQTLLEAIKIQQRKLNRTPAKREMPYKITDMCINSFGSWNAAIIAAGFTPNRSQDHRMYKRSRTKAADGHTCDSISEALIDNWLFQQNIPHERNAQYPETHHKADWLIKNNTFIEYFGLAKDSPRYDRTITEKKMLCEKNGIFLIEIYPKDLYPENRLESKLACVKEKSLR